MAPEMDRSGLDLTGYLRCHIARGYYLKQNAIVAILVFLWVTTLVGIYDFELRLVTPLFLCALLAYATLKSQYHRFRDKRTYFLCSAAIDNLAVTTALYVLGGAGSAGIFTFYIYPIIYHSLTRSRVQIFVVANMAAVMYSIMITLECFDALPYRSVFGFGKPPALTYLGLALGAFLMLNLVALVCDAVTRAFAKTAQELWDAKVSLELSQKELRRLTTETEFLARAISHELRNPLSAAANANALLIDEADTGSAEDVRELGGIVQYNVTKAYDMLTHLRQLLVTVDRQEQVEDVDLGTLLATVVSDVESATRVERGCVEIPQALPTIRGQPQRLAQVFRNLVLNAIEHGAGAAPASVRVDCAEESGQPGYLRFAITDRGPGVPLEHRERVFEPFVTLGKRASDGRGLGLTLARQVIQGAGGRMWVEEAEGGGARFCFTLPRTQSTT